jgi:hypothetical protein
MGSSSSLQGGAYILILIFTAICLALAFCACAEGKQNRDDGGAMTTSQLYGSSALASSNPNFEPELASPPPPDLELLPGRPLNPVRVNTFSPTTKADNPIGLFGTAAVNESVAAAQPLPPRFEPLPELGPQRLWQPTWQGCAPTIVSNSCIFHKPNPRLWARDLNELMFTRSLGLGHDNLCEPVKARQSWIQLLASDTRSRRDKYTRATPQNSLSHSTCEMMARQTPQYTNF